MRVVPRVLPRDVPNGREDGAWRGLTHSDFHAASALAVEEYLDSMARGFDK